MCTAWQEEKEKGEEEDVEEKKKEKEEDVEKEKEDSHLECYNKEK